MATPLGGLIRPCGPVIDAGAAERAHDRLIESASVAGWSGHLRAAWPALAPVFAASPYLAGLASRAPERLRRLLSGPAETSLADVLESVTACSADADIEGAESRLRRLKGDLHLLVALADLGGLWRLEEVTGALTRFADVAVQAALRLAAREACEGPAGVAVGDGPEGPIPGLFVIGMGKLGAFELNYSSDIDLTAFYEPEAIPASEEPSPIPWRFAPSSAWPRCFRAARPRAMSFASI